MPWVLETRKVPLGSSFTADFISVTNFRQILFACVNLSSHSFSGYQNLKPDMTKLKSPEPVLGQVTNSKNCEWSIYQNSWFQKIN